MSAGRSGVEWDLCLHAACLWTGMVSIPEPQPLHAGGAHAGGDSIAQGRHPQCAAGCRSRLCRHSVRAWAPARHHPLSGEAVHSKLSFRGLSLCGMPDVALTARAGSAAILSKHGHQLDSICFPAKTTPPAMRVGCRPPLCHLMPTLLQSLGGMVAQRESLMTLALG